MDWWRAKKTYRRTILIAAPILIGYFLYRVKAVLLPFVLAMILTYLINPLVVKLESRKFPRISAIAIIYLGLGLLFGALIVYGMPELIKELNRFVSSLPEQMKKFEDMFTGLKNSYVNFGLPDGLRQVFDERLAQFEKILVNIARQTLSGITKFFTPLISIIVAPLFAFYMLRDLDNIKNGLVGIIPKEYRTESLALLRDVDDVLSKFIRGYLTVSILIGVITGLSMALIGVDYAFLIGLIAAITDLIPYIGPLIGAVPAVALALVKSKTLALYTLIIITLIQQLESQVITPKILGESLGLHPLLVIFVLLAGGELYGILGMVLALPLTAILKVVLNYFYLKLVG